MGRREVYVNVTEYRSRTCPGVTRWNTWPVSAMTAVHFGPVARCHSSSGAMRRTFSSEAKPEGRSGSLLATSAERVRGM